MAMKKWFDYYIRVVGLFTIIFYIAGAWSNAAFILSDWDPDLREMYAGIWCSVVVIAAIACAMVVENSDKK